MDLDVDDFGCVADGRFLEGVSTAAGSAVLTALGGGLRPVDAGKQVAVPGAADLVATIADLVDRQDVLDASMAAGSPLLTGTLVDPERPNQPLPFRSEQHVGRRMTVAGAGPGGSTLVSGIAQVENTTTVVLDDASASSVIGVEVILNDPARVAMSNYARHSRDGLLVDLGDRSVTDGAVRLGGRGLASATARFSSLDLGKSVTLQAAGLFVTTIASVDSSTQLTLAAPAPRTVAGVAADVWRTDSRPGLTQLLDALVSLDTEGAEIRFGPGVYDFTRIPELNDPMNAAIGLRGLKNLTLRGSGIGATILRLMPNQDLRGPDSHVIETRDCRCLTLRDLSVHGAYLTMGNANEQMHGINLNAGTQDMAIERVAVFQSAGDGIRLLGVEDNKVRKVWIEGCRLVQNKRTGVAFQRASEFVWVRDCHIESREPSTDASIDFEPTGNGAPTDIILDSNMIDHDTQGSVAVSLTGISGPDPARRVKFVNNVVRGGSVFCVDVEHLSIQDNTIMIADDPSRAVGGIPVHVQRGGHGLMISGNLLVNEHADARDVIAISEVNNRPVDRAMIADNLCFTQAGSGIRVQSCEDVVVDGNLLVATGPCSQGIVVHATSESDVSSVSVRDNDITTEDAGSWNTGVQVGGGESAQHITVTGNAIGGASTGVRFQGGTLQQTPICALNRVRADVGTPLDGLAALPEQAVVVAGAANRGGDSPGQGAGRVLAGSGNPNDNQVAGNLGDIYQRVDPQPGPRLFVKEADDTPGIGWTAK